MSRAVLPLAGRVWAAAGCGVPHNWLIGMAVIGAAVVVELGAIALAIVSLGRRRG